MLVDRLGVSKFSVTGSNADSYGHSILCIFCPIALDDPEIYTRLLIPVLRVCASFGNIALSDTQIRSRLNTFSHVSNFSYIVTHPCPDSLYFSYAVNYSSV